MLQGIGEMLVDTGLMVFGVATMDSIPAVITVNTALRSSFFTVVLLSSVGIPGESSLFVWLVDRGPLEPEEKAGSEFRRTCQTALVSKCIESNVKRQKNYVCSKFRNSTNFPGRLQMDSV